MAKTFRVNPYLFLLSKRLLHYEFVRMKKEPSILNLTQLVYDRHKSEKYKQSSYSDIPEQRDLSAFRKAERIKKYLLTPKDFDFTIGMLNHLISELHAIESFETWECYSNYFKDDEGARFAEKKLMHKPFAEFSEDQQHHILTLVNKTMYRLHFYNVRIDKKNNHNIIAHSKNFIIRTANKDEIDDIELIAKRIYPCPINGAELKRSWYEKNPRVFYIFRDDADVWANINLLPITDDMYEFLKTGKYYESAIRKPDIHSLNERPIVNYIYIEGLACTIQKALPLFIQHLSSMIDSLADIKKESLVICAIGGSTEGDLIMKNYGFNMTGWAIDPNGNQKYPFFEILFSKLDQQLKNHEIIPWYYITENNSLTQFATD